jgi:hypothetical protein
MKKFLYTAVITATLWSCGGGGGGDTPPTPTPVNHEPTTPTLVYPTNNLLCIDNQLNFQWNASTDSDGDAITYQIQIATDNSFTQIAQTQTTTATSKTITLEKGIAYYWRVKATDSKNASSSYSSIFNFYTEGNGVTNHAPFAPELVSPVLNAVVTTPTATLQWNGSDADTSDTLTYDVYFDTVNPPTTVISADQSGDLFTTPTLSPTTDYYWKIVVKDNHGGQTIGQIWNFKTD